MGVWEPTVQTTTGLAEGAFTVLYALLPKETAHIQVDRTDLGTSDAVRIFVQSSVDQVVLDDVSITEMVIPADKLRESMFVTGPGFFRVGMEPIGSSDAVVVTIRIRRDGGIV